VLGALALSCALAWAQEEGGRGGGGVGATGGRGSDGNRVFLGLGPKPDLQQALRGQPLYEAHCGGCHGLDARGGSGGNLLYSNLVMTDVAGSNIIPVIRNGKGRMAAVTAVTEAQAADIAMYLDQLFEDVANRGTYSYAPREKILVGNVASGKVYFDGNCASCHTPDALRAKGIGRRAPQEIQQAWLAPRGGPAPVYAVTVGSNAPIAGALVRKSDFDITLTVNGSPRTIPIDADTKVQLVEDRMAEHDRIVDRISNAEMHNVTAYLETLK
jgi:cytochrome c oxidase cbb3-type subunit 3